MRTTVPCSLFLLGALVLSACADDEAASTGSGTSTTGSLTGAGGSGDGGSKGSGGASSSGPSGPAGPGSGPSGPGATTGNASGPSGTTGSGGASATSSSGSGATVGSTTTGSGGGPGGSTVRFVAMGDGGEGNDTQYAVAAMVKNVCDARGGCAFVIYLGDNFYDSGVDDTEDDQFQTQFEQPYADLEIPFYVVLGNHDYGGNGAGYEQWKAQVQVDYSNQSKKWNMPARFYGFGVPADVGPADGTRVDFFGLDTNWIMYTGDEEQQDWLDGATAASTATWKIGFGHHPYVSNGQHGNAGEYEGIPYIPIVSGENVEDFMEDSVCGKIDVYFSGHDHNRQWLEPACGTEFIVSGTAAKTTDLVGRGTPTFFEDDADGGFMLVEITGNTLVGQFYDQQGNVEFERTVTQP